MKIASATFIALTALQAASAMAQDAKPMRMIVPFPPGGGTDTISRALTQQVGKAQGWTFAVENRPGAGSVVGIDLVVQSPADGYTFLLNTNGQAISPSIYKSLPYDSDKDLVRVSALTGTSTVIVVNNDLPVKTWEDVNKPGVRIAVPQASSMDRFVSEHCKDADIQRFPDNAAAIAAFHSAASLPARRPSMIEALSARVPRR